MHQKQGSADTAVTSMQAMNEMPCMEDQRLLRLLRLPLLRDRLCFAIVNPGSLSLLRDATKG
jgi:hypothetical protein